jgi:hypothetical protein
VALWRQSLPLLLLLVLPWLLLSVLLQQLHLLMQDGKLVMQPLCRRQLLPQLGLLQLQLQLLGAGQSCLCIKQFLRQLLEKMQAGFCAVGVKRQVEPLGLQLLPQVGQPQHAPCACDEHCMHLRAVDGSCVVWRTKLHTRLLLLAGMLVASRSKDWDSWAVKNDEAALVVQQQAANSSIAQLGLHKSKITVNSLVLMV